MEWTHRSKPVENAEGWKDFFLHCQRFFGYHNFSESEINGIVHHINSVYFMGKEPKLNGDNKAEVWKILR